MNLCEPFQSKSAYTFLGSSIGVLTVKVHKGSFVKG